jgi:hypothetical protein
MEQSKVLIVGRPAWDDVMAKRLAEYTGRIVNEWCNNETSFEECVEAAEKVLRYNSEDDGYELAKAFEDEGFGSNTELVELLDDVRYEKITLLFRSLLAQ